MTQRVTQLVLVIPIIFLSFAGRIWAAGPIDYLRDIKPIFKEHCFACHGPLKQQSHLRLDTVKSMLTGGDSGAAIVPGRVDDSLLIGAVTGDAGFQMPPEGEASPLDAKQIALLKAWK